MTAPVFTLAALGDFYARGGDAREVARVALAAIEAWAEYMAAPRQLRLSVPCGNYPG
jgi:hypothetical protein